VKNNNGLSLIFIIFLILFFSFIGAGAYFGYKFYQSEDFANFNKLLPSFLKNFNLDNLKNWNNTENNDLEQNPIDEAPIEETPVEVIPTDDSIQTEEITINNTSQESNKILTPIEIPAEEVKLTAPKVNANPFPIKVVTSPPRATTPAPVTTPPSTPNYSTTKLNKKIYLVIFNPVINGKTTVNNFNWNNPDTLTQNVMNFFKDVTGGRVTYSIAKRTSIDTFPIKQDGFKYDSTSYLKCMTSQNKSSDCHNPDTANYLEILKLTDACTLLNNGEIDELWMWGGPYFGFYESNVAGPNAFYVNSGPTTGSTCNKILPIMGFNYERSSNEAIHNFGHRAESVMKEVYGSWKPEKTHGWNSFSLVDKDVKGQAGCGNTHFTSASTKDYQYDPSQKVLSNCDEYMYFPNIKGVYKEVSCSAWGCSQIGYYKYWWTRFPQNTGKSIDSFTNKEISNNWLIYVFDFAWKN